MSNKYYNNEKTSNHIHLSCGNEFNNPRVLYNIYIIWMIVEPLILLMCPYWRRNNDRYCSSLYSTFLTRLKSTTAVKDEYMKLINIDLASTTLFDSVFQDLYYLRSIANQFNYNYISKIEQIRVKTQAQKDINDTLDLLAETIRKSSSKPTNHTILFPPQSADPDNTKVSRMIIASAFQNYIGKAKSDGQYKQNIARYSGINSLNMLNVNCTPAK